MAKRAAGRFLDILIQVKRKSRRRRWEDSRKRQVFEEDTLHGDLEKYNRRSRQHKGTVDPATGEIIKDPVKGRTLEK